MRFATRARSAGAESRPRWALPVFATAIAWIAFATMAHAASASPASVDVATARVYTVAGAGEAGAPLRDGMPATDAMLGMIERIAAMPDGGFVVVSFGAGGSHRADLLRVDASGRVRRFAEYRRDVFEEDVAAGPDGSV
jgi:hypothetical protein